MIFLEYSAFADWTIARRVDKAAAYLSRLAVSRSRAIVANTSPFFTRSPIDVGMETTAPLIRAANIACAARRQPTDNRASLGQRFNDHCIDPDRAGARSTARFFAAPSGRLGPLGGLGRSRLFRTLFAGEKTANLAAVQRAGFVTIHIVEIGFQRASRLITVNYAVLVLVSRLAAIRKRRDQFLRRGSRLRRSRLFRTFFAGEKTTNLAAVQRAGFVTIHIVEIGFQRASRLITVNYAVLVLVSRLAAIGQFLTLSEREL